MAYYRRRRSSRRRNPRRYSRSRRRSYRRGNDFVSTYLLTKAMKGNGKGIFGDKGFGGDKLMKYMLLSGGLQGRGGGGLFGGGGSNTINDLLLLSSLKSGGSKSSSNNNDNGGGTTGEKKPESDSYDLLNENDVKKLAEYINKNSGAWFKFTSNIWTKKVLKKIIVIGRRYITPELVDAFIRQNGGKIRNYGDANQVEEKRRERSGSGSKTPRPLFEESSNDEGKRPGKLKPPKPMPFPGSGSKSDDEWFSGTDEPDTPGVSRLKRKKKGNNDFKNKEENLKDVMKGLKGFRDETKPPRTSFWSKFRMPPRRGKTDAQKNAYKDARGFGRKMWDKTKKILGYGSDASVDDVGGLLGGEIPNDDQGGRIFEHPNTDDEEIKRFAGGAPKVKTTQQKISDQQRSNNPLGSGMSNGTGAIPSNVDSSGKGTNGIGSGVGVPEDIVNGNLDDLNEGEALKYAGMKSIRDIEDEFVGRTPGKQTTVQLIDNNLISSNFTKEDAKFLRRNLSRLYMGEPQFDMQLLEWIRNHFAGSDKKANEFIQNLEDNVNTNARQYIPMSLLGKINYARPTPVSMYADGNIRVFPFGLTGVTSNNWEKLADNNKREFNTLGIRKVARTQDNTQWGHVLGGLARVSKVLREQREGGLTDEELYNMYQGQVGSDYPRIPLVFRSSKLKVKD